MKDEATEETQSEQQKEKRNVQTEESLRDFWNNLKHSDNLITGVQEGENKGQGIQNLLTEIMTENFPHRGKEKDTQSPKQDELQKTHPKTHHNENG